MAGRAVGQEMARRLATWAVLVASLTGAVLFVGLRFTTPSDGGRVVFYGDAWSSTGVRIEPIDAPAPGLEPGDRVEAVADRSLEAWIRDVLDADTARPATGPVPYVVERDATRVATTVEWGPPSIGGALTTGWSVLLFSIAIAGLAGYVFARRPHVPAASALVLVASGAAGSSLPWFVGVTTSDIVLSGPFLFHATLTAGLYMLLWPAGVHLGLVFPAPLPVTLRRRWLIPAVYVAPLGAYAVVMAVTFATTTSGLAWVGSWPSIQLAFVVPLLVASLLLFVRQYVRGIEPAEKARMRLAALGAVISAVLGLLLFMGPELLLGESVIPAAAIGLAALPLPIGFAAAILRDRLFDIDAAINRTLVYGGLTMAVLGTYLVAVGLVTTVVGVDEGYAGSLLATGIAALVALPLRDVLQRTANRLMYGDRDDPWRALHRLGSRLEWAADPDRALPAIAETVADALRLPYVAVEVADELGNTVVAAEHGQPSQASAPVPLVHGGEPVGRLVLGVRRGERGFRPDELALLGDLARHAGAAVQRSVSAVTWLDRASVWSSPARRSAAGYGATCTTGSGQPSPRSGCARTPPLPCSVTIRTRLPGSSRRWRPRRATRSTTSAGWSTVSARPPWMSSGWSGRSEAMRRGSTARIRVGRLASPSRSAALPARSRICRQPSRSPPIGSQWRR